jgi:hypothetical protein
VYRHPDRWVYFRTLPDCVMVSFVTRVGSENKASPPVRFDHAAFNQLRCSRPNTPFYEFPVVHDPGATLH